MSGRVLFHVQHLLGIGHLQRTLRIAEALAARGIAVTLVSGGPPVSVLDDVGGIDILQLPPIRARDATFALIDGAGRPVDEALRTERRELLLAAFAAVRPDAVVIEGFPFARRAFRFELDPLIASARAVQTPVVCSVRDIPTVRDDPARHAEIVARIQADFAAVLVHGDPAFIPFEVPFPPAAQIAARLAYTGYVTNSHLTLPSPRDGPLPLPPEGRRGDDLAVQLSLSAPGGGEGRGEVEGAKTLDEVLVSVGGGAAGQKLLAAALAARRLGCLTERSWRMLAGAALSDDDFAALQSAAPAGVVIERFRNDFPALLRRCHVSVSQAGYNTVLDIVAARARAVLVPFAAERETEQLIRAEHLAARGAALVVREAELTPALLAAAIERAAARDPVSLALDTGGARRSAELIAELIAK